MKDFTWNDKENKISNKVIMTFQYTDHAYAKLWGQEHFTSQNKGDMKKHRKKMMNIKMVHKRTQ